MAIALKILRSQKGISTVMVPALMLIILSFVAYAIDLGRAFILRHELQAACDAAAIAGTSMYVVEFAENEDGSVDINNEVIKIVEEAANSEATRIFVENFIRKDLGELGVKTIYGDNLNEGRGEVIDYITYKYYVTADIPYIFAGAFLNMGPSQRVSLSSEATIKQ